KGDAKCYAIACASIVAKVTRDRLMHSLHTRYDGYGWITNSGYATLEHRHGILARGLTPHHRRTFCMKAQTELLLESTAQPVAETVSDSFGALVDVRSPLDESLSDTAFDAFQAAAIDSVAE